MPTLMSNYKTTLTSLLCAFFFVTLLSFGKGHNVGSLLLLITSLVMLNQWRKGTFSHNEKLFCLSFLAYYLVYIINMLIWDGSISDSDQASRFALAIPVFLMLVIYPPKTRWIVWGIIIGSIVSGASALLQWFLFDRPRGFSGLNSNWWLKGYMPIQNGNMAMTFASLSLCIALYFLSRDRLVAFFAFMASIAGLMASMYSQSRGGWMVLPITLIFLYLTYRKTLSFKTKIISILVACLCLTGLATTPQVQSRVEVAIKNIESYSQGSKYTSVGIRLELWKSAWLNFKQQPILGVGEKERRILNKHWGEIGLVDKKTANYPTHAHNQYLDDLSVRGILGIASLLAIFIVPLILLWRIPITHEYGQLTRQLGTVHIVAFMIYSLSQAMFSHNSGTIFYALTTSILVAVHLQFCQSREVTS